jgi:hypothetical protein
MSAREGQCVVFAKGPIETALTLTPYLPSSTGAADYTIESGAAAAAPAPN